MLIVTFSNKNAILITEKEIVKTLLSGHRTFSHGLTKVIFFYYQDKLKKGQVPT